MGFRDGVYPPGRHFARMYGLPIGVEFPLPVVLFEQTFGIGGSIALTYSDVWKVSAEASDYRDSYVTHKSAHVPFEEGTVKYQSSYFGVVPCVEI